MKNMTQSQRNKPSLSIESLEETTKSINLSDIELNVILQARTEMKSKTVSDYEKAYSNGAKFPPLLVAEINNYKGESAYLLLDGWHRYSAMTNINWMLPIEVRAIKIPRGTPIEQLIFIGGRENLRNGLALSSKDKKELFRTYIKGGHNKVGRKYKSYRVIAGELQTVTHQTLHIWMKQEFPSIAMRMGIDHPEEISVDSKATGTGHTLTVMTDLSSKGLGLLALDIVSAAKASDDFGREQIANWLKELDIALKWEAPFTPSKQPNNHIDKVNKLTLKDDTFMKS